MLGLANRRLQPLGDVSTQFKHLPRLSVPIITFERLEVAIRSVPPSVDRG
jgi:hypothetical protein